VVSWCTQQVIANTTILMSNIKGPSEEIAIADNPAITIYMVSYAGKASLQVLVAKDIIPDPEILVNYFQESFMDIRNSIKKTIDPD
ncbi:O-acyltransferase WSD1, partial [Bienertia sinuspersici]